MSLENIAVIELTLFVMLNFVLIVWLALEEEIRERRRQD